MTPCTYCTFKHEIMVLEHLVDRRHTIADFLLVSAFQANYDYINGTVQYFAFYTCFCACERHFLTIFHMRASDIKLQVLQSALQSILQPWHGFLYWAFCTTKRQSMKLFLWWFVLFWYIWRKRHVVCHAVQDNISVGHAPHICQPHLQARSESSIVLRRR